MQVTNRGKSRGVRLQSQERRLLDGVDGDGGAMAILSGLGGWHMLGDKIASDEAAAAYKAVRIVVERLDGKGAKVA